ncbi:hypothetical protein SAMN05216358_0104 [Rhizobium sp. AN5]|uniref:hypothetical protein n=1 Tax=Rhizobium sp. AN5 TaxID=1855304 RepID=UPI000BD721A5|nr:hypothetical protein [Rhizobium sp. AN5]SOC90084.1 hypothetical protein SAMN05216358_0104 [Rhizobium sp. AN5]
MSKVKILSAIASNSGVTLFLDNGEELNLKKDTKRTKEILDQTVEALKRGEHMEIDLATFSIEKTIEEKTNGVVRFVRGRFSQLKALLGGTPSEPEPKTTTVVLGSVKPTPAPTPVMELTKPSVSSRYVPQDKGPAVEYEPEELHAVVNNKVIPGVEALTPYMDAINHGEDAAGFQKFMERIASVIDSRSHTIKELLNFMSKGDLPIADDGSIVAYKVLQSTSNGFVDCHSRKVTQKLGSFVQMDEKLVDPNRRNECSTGLHIARRGYLSGFSGDIITLVKVAPEDVIAVPPGEPNKMRAKGYHIVAVLPADVHPTLRSNKPMTGHEKASKLLADVIKGNHTSILEIVNIGSAYGGNVTVTPVEGAKKMARADVGTSGVAKALDDRPEVIEEKVDVSIRDLRKRVDEVELSRQKKPSKAVQKAAASGDLSAAISAAMTAPSEPVSSPESKIGKGTAKPTPEKVEKSKKVVEKAKAEKELPEKHTLALVLHAEGKSNRQIEAELHICRKTLKKLFDARGLKPNG